MNTWFRDTIPHAFIFVQHNPRAWHGLTADPIPWYSFCVHEAQLSSPWLSCTSVSPWSLAAAGNCRISFTSSRIVHTISCRSPACSSIVILGASTTACSRIFLNLPTILSWLGSMPNPRSSKMSKFSLDYGMCQVLTSPYFLHSAGYWHIWWLMMSARIELWIGLNLVITHWSISDSKSVEFRRENSTSARICWICWSSSRSSRSAMPHCNKLDLAPDSANMAATALRALQKKGLFMYIDNNIYI